MPKDVRQRSRWNQFALKANLRARRLGIAERLSLHPDRPCEPCHYCGDPSANSWDHVVALAKGGANTMANLVPCCYSCNRRKHVHPASEIALYPIRVLCGWCWAPLSRSRQRIRSAERLGHRAFVCNARCAGRLSNHPLTRQLMQMGPRESSSVKPHTIYMRSYRLAKRQEVLAL